MSEPNKEQQEKQKEGQQYQANNLDPTHSETVVDETGVPVKEVPPASKLDKTDDERKSSRSFAFLCGGIALVVIAIVVGVTLGVVLTRDDDDGDNANLSILDGTWIPYGQPIEQDAETLESPQELKFWNWDVHQEKLVIAGLSADHTAQVAWYAWQDEPKGTADWVHVETLPIGDDHPQSFPSVYLRATTLLVADSQGVLPINDDPDLTGTAYHGLVTVFHLNNQTEQMTLVTQKVQDNLWGDKLAMDDKGETIVVGAPLVDHQLLIDAGSLQAYQLKNGALSTKGSSLHGQEIFDSLGKAGLALSGNGQLLAAGVPLDGSTSGAIRIWTWINDDWQPLGDEISGEAGQGLGQQLQLNHDGNVLVSTTLISSQVLAYKFECQENSEQCTWKQMGQVLDGTAVDMYGNSQLAIVDGETVRVYEYNDNQGKWLLRGDALPGIAARWLGQHRLVIEQKGGVLQTWHWALT